MPSEALFAIETPRLGLRPMRGDDVDGMLRIFTDPNVMASFDINSFTRRQMQDWVKSNLEHQSKFGYGLFAVIQKANGTLIGDCGLEWRDVQGVFLPELGYDFHSDYWNQGLATEAATAVRDYAFGELYLSRLASLIRVGNEASRRVAEKVGMKLLTEFTSPRGIRYWQYGITSPLSSANISH
jgi:ribosomal-protein-alanine N-acetyltransferase